MPLTGVQQPKGDGLKDDSKGTLHKCDLTEPNEQAIVVLSNAIVEPFAVMVEAVGTSIARSTVLTLLVCNERVANLAKVVTPMGGCPIWLKMFLLD